MVGKLDQRGRRDDLDLGARPRRFRPARGRADQALAARIGADGGGPDWSTGGITESKRATPGDSDGSPPDRLGGCVGGAIGGGGADSLPCNVL